MPRFSRTRYTDLRKANLALSVRLHVCHLSPKLSRASIQGNMSVLSPLRLV